MRGFDALLVFRLARQPTWLLGFACMMTAGISVFLRASAPTGGQDHASATLGVGTGAMLLTSHTTQPRMPEAGEATNRELTRRSG